MILKYTLGHYPMQALKSQSISVVEKQTINKNERINKIQQIKKEWNDYGLNNKGMDAATLTFYFSLLSIMNISSASNILQVGCGTGKLIPLAIMLKPQKTTYLATDLTQNMIESARDNLNSHFLKYDSKLSFEQWCLKHNLSFKVANGEQIIEPKINFDRIICNCVLMITQNPIKMLQSLFNQAQKQCLLGISIWGDKSKNPILKFITELIKEQSQGNFVREQFHLYRKVREMAEKIGWELVLQWQQNSIVPIFDIQGDNNDFSRTLDFFIKYLPEQKREEGGKRIREKARQLMDRKEGMTFWSELYIFKKP